MALAMLVPAAVDFGDGSPDWPVFVQTAIFTGMISGLVAMATQNQGVRFSPRLGFLLTASLWLTAAFLGALPLYFSHLPISFAGAFFESMSGITTTGSTVLTGLDKMSRGVLLWRSLLCWLGGIGFIGLALLLLPSLRVGGIQLFHMESSDKSEKILPRVNQIALGIVLAYVGLSALCMLSYFLAGMSMFDAINHAMTTLATAGYSTHDTSLGFYAHNRLLLVISTIFMMLAALPFVLYIKAVMPRRLSSLVDPQVTLFLFLVVGFSFTLAIMLRVGDGLPFSDALITAAFNLVSIITTTGYATEDYSLWGPLSIGIFFLASFIGGCAGSTSGGIKMNRLIILWRLAIASMTRLIMPHAIVKIRYGESEVSTEAAQTVLLFFFLYMASLILGAMVLATLGLDFVSAFTGALTALSNVGPGLGDTIGPVGNFSTVSDPALWVLSYLMLAGRLEIVTIVILFTRSFWAR
ncbi:TrkH family potassium uptake protein [Phyllobacterium salinisoli]|uniref:Trk system potassium uptake protein n=1 Tax=Phyllobacterium salinisoli TaxID=1899321 RepID=A0A368KAJ6_9HYPH|nr:TrkH family potassium uptake protein [Phyllobacterium salinisoli]RCS25523.1 TrkH family potassium uptake protein [Phyllobacterium salinisoli]